MSKEQMDTKRVVQLRYKEFQLKMVYWTKTHNTEEFGPLNVQQLVECIESVSLLAAKSSGRRGSRAAYRQATGNKNEKIEKFKIIVTMMHLIIL